jgi:hypothetical protein
LEAELLEQRIPFALRGIALLGEAAGYFFLFALQLFFHFLKFYVVEDVRETLVVVE